MDFYDFVYVILHFLTVEDTINAVDSLRKIKHVGKYKIVIVDNGSANGSKDKLYDQYASSYDIELVVSESNLGFANGNNLGVKYAREHFKFNYIITMNNDIICSQSSMESKIVDEYLNSSFDLLGPMILTADGRYDNSPIKKLPINRTDIINTYNREKKLLLIENLYLSRIYRALIRLRRAKKQCSKEVIHRVENVVLHGCFIIFSMNYFNKFEDAFDSRTFLYHEEELLGLRIQKKNLVSVYNPDIHIFHKEDSASNASINGNHNRRLYKLKHCIKSSEIIISDFNRLS